MAIFGNPHDFGTLIIGEDFDASTNPIVSHEIRFLIKDDNNAWVDFSDRVENKGSNRLISISSFKHTSEKKAGLPFLETSIDKVVLNNSDSFFEGQVTGLNTVDGVAASFTSSFSSGVK